MKKKINRKLIKIITTKNYEQISNSASNLFMLSLLFIIFANETKTNDKKNYDRTPLLL